MKFLSLNQLPLTTDDFSFRFLNDINISDAIVVHNPQEAIAVSPVLIRSKRTLREHVLYIQKNKIKKAIVVAEDIHFLKECPSLEYLLIIPSMTSNCFDYSPLYEMPNLKWLRCETMYGWKGERTATIDYSRMQNLKSLGLSGKKGNQNVNSAKNIEELYCDCGFPNSDNLEGILPNDSLTTLSINQSPIRTLDGIESATNLCNLELTYNRRLVDISAIKKLSKTLTKLKVDACGKIADFSVLSYLGNITELTLKGNNTLPNLFFLKGMPKLMAFQLTMDVEDGDISLCKNVSWKNIKHRKHFRD